jgi:hypothetical protein
VASVADDGSGLFRSSGQRGRSYGWEKSCAVADDGEAYGRRHLLEGGIESLSVPPHPRH